MKVMWCLVTEMSFVRVEAWVERCFVRVAWIWAERSKRPWQVAIEGAFAANAARAVEASSVKAGREADELKDSTDPVLECRVGGLPSRLILVLVSRTGVNFADDPRVSAERFLAQSIAGLFS